MVRRWYLDTEMNLSRYVLNENRSKQKIAKGMEE